MKRTVQLAAIVVVASSFSLAQARGIPASVTSFSGHNPTPGIGASVTSVGPRGFGGGVGFGQHFGQHFGGHFGGGFGGGVVFGGGVRFGQRPVFVHRPRIFPVYVPVYSYPVGYPIYAEPVYAEPVYGAQGVYDPPVQPVYGAVTNQYDPAAYQAMQPKAPADAAAENRARNANDDPRYGDHYLDDREARARNDAAGNVTVQRVEPRASTTEREPTPEREPDEPATVLVFRDGHRVEVRNYAIVGNTVWDLSEHLAKRISLDTLDLDATIKVNDERGTPFRYPRTRG
jgi:hypothetical protein